MFSRMMLSVLTTLLLSFKIAQALPASSLIDTLSGASNGAMYFQTNEVANNVVALNVHVNGTLSLGGRVLTGGVGASSISSATNMTAAPDGLSSQGSVKVVGHNLFVVNAGDNTVSIFAIDAYNPTNLTLLGEPAKLPGEFPVSVDASLLHELVCVATTGASSGVTCAPYSPNVGIGKFDFLRSFELGQSTPPVGPANTVSQVYFSEDETSLITTVKGKGTPENNGFVSIYPVVVPSGFEGARLAPADIRTSLNETNLLFGFQQIPESSQYFVADPSFGAAIISVDEASGVSRVLHRQEIPGQKATCWAAVSPASNSAFVTDPRVGHVVELSLFDASIVSVLNTTRTYVDIAAAGGYVYALSPGSSNSSGVEVSVISGAGNGQRTVLQSLSVGDWAGISAQGAAVFPSGY
ncbi:LAMI_0F02190g1_1 [Lachancea mirantina]|uniref:LAMI_0F02190g1_1 n=1 Tax=Lachancea mirantina TaxID=1230905 RepID=A0A1G4JWC6_9SACH|nr:LAMI_0F02190g1_1 [Lachancea mirantina]